MVKADWSGLFSVILHVPSDHILAQWVTPEKENMFPKKGTFQKERDGVPTSVFQVNFLFVFGTDTLKIN